jgi:uncharacterized protein YabN with tetrapyrrole methylase and pyrophosphatase domain
MPSDIYLIGSGIRGTLHFTNEALQALRVCRSAYVLHPDTMVLDYVRRYCDEVHDLTTFYDGREIRQDVYSAIADRLIEEAAQSGPVAFLVHGHPLFLVSATEYTLDQAASKGLKATVLAAVSSFDTLLCDLGIDYGYGVQIFDSTTMIENSWAPNPKVHLLVFQLATTCNRRIVKNSPAGPLLRPLVDFLAPVYGPSHPVRIVHSGAALLEETEIIDLCLSELTADDIDLERRPTLYVPPLG